MKTQPYPEKFEIDIDRDALTSYLQKSWLTGWMFLPCFIISMMLLGLFTHAIQIVEKRGFDRLLSQIPQGLFIASMVILGSITLSVILYLLSSHRQAKKYAQGLQLFVDGAFLRIIYPKLTHIDRKIHFRAITDYTVITGSLMKKYGIQSLSMTTTGSMCGNIIVTGVKNCQQVRNMLADIDADRELR